MLKGKIKCNFSPFPVFLSPCVSSRTPLPSHHFPYLFPITMPSIPPALFLHLLPIWPPPFAPRCFLHFSLFITFSSRSVCLSLPQYSLSPQTCLRALGVSASPTDCPLSWECSLLSPLTSSTSSASFSCLAGGRIRWWSAPGSWRPLGLKPRTWLTSGPGAEQLIRLNLALDLVEIWTLFGDDRRCLPCLFACCYTPVSRC